MSTSPSNLDNSGSISPGFNVSQQPQDPLNDFNMLKNWAPQAMEALRRSNLKTQVANPQLNTTPQSPGIAKGLISGLL